MTPTLLETLTPGAPDVSIAVFAPLPKPFGEKDRQKLAVAVRTLSEGSQEYPRRTAWRMTDGRTIDASLLPDGVAIRFAVPKENLANGIALVEGLLRRPLVPQEDLDRNLVAIQRREPGYWAAALRPLSNDLKSLKQEEARALLRRVFDPKRVVVAVGGDFDAGKPTEFWANRTEDWKPDPGPRYPDITPTPEPSENPAGVTTVELRGPAFAAADPTLAPKWLALVALGVGKGSALFEKVRQVEGWSYRQEAILWPDPAGLVPRLVAATVSDEDESGRAEALRKTLQTAVDAWTEADRARAIGLAAASLERGLPLGPLWLVDGPPGVYDRSLLDAYWWSKAGVRWDPNRLAAALRNVTLDELKSTAAALLAGAKPIVLPGR